ncbi:MAG: TIGR02996 domain-containing protein [Myxococcales bacterium]|nr:TIGR02996 domain-containing protein [Myxococcales bacterium]
MDRSEPPRARDELALARTVWRGTRDATVAEAIDALDREVRASFCPPETRTNAAFQRAWLALAEADDPVAAGFLAEHLFAKLPGADADAKLDAFIDRLQAAQKTPDPRLARALSTLVEQGPPIVRWASDTCEETLAVIGDTRTAGPLERLLPTFEPAVAEKWRRVIDRIPRGGPPADLERWRRLAGSRSAPDRDALFRAVLSAPDDDGALSVLADALQELGDPRGEFIAIQLAETRGAASLAATKRADALLKKHKKEWLGPLARVTYRATFRRGVVEELELDGSWKASPAAWAELARCPLLRTVRSISGKATDDLLVQFLVSDEMPSLRVVTVESDVIADALQERTPPRLEELRSTDWRRRDHGERFAERVVPLFERTSSVDAVVCTGDTLDTLLASPASGRLRRVGLEKVADESAFACWARLPASCGTLAWGWSSRTELRRERSGVVLFHSLDRWTDLAELASLAATIPSLSKVEIVGPKAPDVGAFSTLTARGVTVTARALVPRSGRAGGMAGG